MEAPIPVLVDEISEEIAAVHAHLGLGLRRFKIDAADRIAPPGVLATIGLARVRLPPGAILRSLMDGLIGSQLGGRKAERSRCHLASQRIVDKPRLDAAHGVARRR